MPSRSTALRPNAYRQTQGGNQGWNVEIDEDDFMRYTMKILTEPLEPVTIRATH